MTEPLEAPRLWTRLAARLHGEVPADQLEAHWDGVYGTEPTDSVSWYEARPVMSMRLFASARIT